MTPVRDLDLTVEAGEVFGFLGPNGAGKSTTINVMLDYVRPTSGTVTILGHDPRTNPRAVRERVGVLPEASGFYDRDTARDHLRFATAMKRANDDPETLLERVGIADAADRTGRRPSPGFIVRPSTLSTTALHPVLLAPPIAGLAMAVVFRDAHRRALPARTTAAWTLGVGVLSLAGFVAAFSFDGALYRQYLLLSGESLVVRTPYELLTWTLAVGTAFSAVLCLVYAVGSRVGARRAA
ncbi:MAG: ATP-binding cassette domain-containing protein [Haloferacaceae archaeon]